MKQNLPFLWWLVSTAAIAGLFAAMGYEADQAVLLAVVFLPGMIVLRYFVPQLSFADRRKGLANALCLLGAVVTIECLALVFGHRAAFDTLPDTLPGMAFNPLFIALLLVAFIVPEQLLEHYTARQHSHNTKLTFTSERRKITLDPAVILYLESNDDEVWIRTVPGESFRSKTRISQWEALLDQRFLRVHRSYIVNTEHIDEWHPTRIRIGDRQIEISRKYKDQVRDRLGRELRADTSQE